MENHFKPTSYLKSIIYVRETSVGSSTIMQWWTLEDNEELQTPAYMGEWRGLPVEVIELYGNIYSDGK